MSTTPMTICDRCGVHRSVHNYSPDAAGCAFRRTMQGLLCEYVSETGSWLPLEVEVVEA